MLVLRMALYGVVVVGQIDKHWATEDAFYCLNIGEFIVMQLQDL
jgi:hypothetical protein